MLKIIRYALLAIRRWIAIKRGKVPYSFPVTISLNGHELSGYTTPDTLLSYTTAFHVDPVFTASDFQENADGSWSFTLTGAKNEEDQSQ